MKLGGSGNLTFSALEYLPESISPQSSSLLTKLSSSVALQCVLVNLSLIIYLFLESDGRGRDV